MSINNATATGTQNKKRDIPVAYSLPQTEAITTYVRPADWLTMPTVLSTDQTVVLLVAVENCTTNFFSLSCTVSGGGTYTVNWGDGTPNSVTASGTTTYHNFDWNNVSSGTLTTRGYRQAIVTITPTTTNLLTVDFTTSYIDSSVVSPPTGWNNKILESIIAGSNLTQALFSGISNQASAWMEQTTVLSLSSSANLSGMYNTCRSLQNVVSFPNGNYVNLPFMFANCHSLQVAPNFTFATSGVSMASMFVSCFKLQSVPLYNTIGVTNMSSMFQNCYALNNVPFFNTVNVTDMATMFQNCFALSSVPPFDTGNVTSMSQMFGQCYSLKTVPTFNTIKVTNASNMFIDCRNLITAPPFNLVACTNTAAMYRGCFSMETAPAYNLPVCTQVANMYTDCYSLVSVGTMTTSGLLTNMSQLFTQCRSLIEAPQITNTTNVTNMTELFYTCYALTTIPVYDTANVTTMNGMFGFTTSLKNPPAINTSKATNFTGMFASSGISTTPLYDTSNVIIMSTCFIQARNLTTVPLYNTSKVTLMNAMFQETPALTEIPAWDTSNVTNFQNFALTSGVRRVGALNTSKATTIAGMFNQCTNLVTLPTTFNFSNVTTSVAPFAACYGLSIAPSNNLKVTTSYASCSLGETALKNVFIGLGTATGAQTLNIGGNPGTVAAVSKTVALTANSNSVTLANTVGLSTGMQMAFTTNATSNIATTMNANSTITLPVQLNNNTELGFTSVTTSNLTINTLYYTVYDSGSAPSVIHKLTTTPGGANLTFTAGTGTSRFNPKIASITANTSFTFDCNMPNNVASGSIAFRSLQTNIATIKNWIVSG